MKPADGLMNVTQTPAGAITSTAGESSGAITDSSLTVLDFIGHTAPYLQLPPGTPTLNILKLAEASLAEAIQAAAEQAGILNGAVVKEKIFSFITQKHIRLTVTPFQQKGDRYFSILFEEEKDAATEKNTNGSTPVNSTTIVSHTAAADDVFHLGIETGHIGIWNQDIEKNEIYWSREQEALYGLSEGEFGKRLEDFQAFVFPEDFDAIKKEQEKQHGEEHSYQFRIKRKDGEVRWIQARSKSIFDKNGTLVSITGINIDITEQVSARQKKEDAEARLLSFAKNSPDIITRHDRNFTYLYASPAIEKVTGQKPEVFIGHTCREMGLSEELCIFFENQLSLVFNKKEQHTTSYKNEAGNCFHSRMVPEFDQEGTVISVLVISTDITELKHREEELQKLATHFKLAADSAQAGTWSLNTVTMHLQWSPLHKHLWGYDETRNDLSYTDWHSIIHPDDKQRCFDAVAAAEINHTLYEASYRIIRHNDGVVRWIRSTGQYHYNTAGAAVMLTGISTDITPQVQAEEEKNKFTHIIESSDEFIGFASLDRRLMYINPAGLQMLGLTDATGKDLMELVYEEDKELVKQLIKNLLKEGSFRQEIRLINRSTGKPFWILWNAFVIRDEKTGMITGIGTVSPNISERKIWESELQASEKLFRLLAQNSPDVITRLDKNGRYIYVSPLLKNLTGMDTSGFVGKTYREAGVAENLCNFFDEHITEVYSSKKMFTGEFESMKGLHIYTRMVPEFDEEGEVTSVLMIHADITELKKAEEKIKRSEEKFRSLFNNMDQGFCIIEVLFNEQGKAYDYRFIEYNAVFNKQTGLENAIGKTMKDLQPNIEEYWFGIYGKVATTGTPIRFTEESAAMQRWFDVYAFRLNDDNSNQVAILFTDISERKKIEQQLKEREQRFRSLAQNSPDVISRVDKDFRYLYVNPKAAEVIKLKASDIIGKKSCEIGLPDDLCNSYEENFAIAFKKQSLHTVELFGPDGGCYYTRMVTEPDENGEIQSLLIISTDITERKKAEDALKASEERFRTLAETIPQLVWMTDEEGKNEYVSGQWEAYTGLDPYDENSWSKMVHPEDMPDMMKNWSSSLQTGEVYHAEARLKSTEGIYQWHVVDGVPIKNEDGKIIKWIGAFTDIEEQKIKEQQKDEFISIASHEMKTPLTTAKGYLELLLHTLDEDNEMLTLYAGKASTAVDRLHHLVTELLDASKIQHGKLNLNISRFNVDELISETIENIQYTAPAHHISYTGLKGIEISGDRDRLQQVVINLLTNAIKYSPNADKVKVHTQIKDKQVQVSVQDWGVGMSKQHLDKIFDRYYRVKEHAIYFQGLGIGLYISYDIVQRHNGTMWAESEPGVGSTFYFTLPLM